MIGALIALLSLDMTRKLVAAGMVASTYELVGATNTTPIVVETQDPHGLTRPVHGVISGVVGNTAANDLWVCSVVDATHLQLTTFTAAGAVVQSVGNGVYLSGGMLQVAFPDGQILLGRRNIAMHSAVATPRIVFVPQGSPAWSFVPYGGQLNAIDPPRRLSGETTEQKTMLQLKNLGTEPHRFEVHVTGSAVPPDPDFGDFDVTQALYQSLYASMFHMLTPPLCKILDGKWASQDAAVQQFDVRGQRWVAHVEILQPVTDNPLAFVPTSTDASITVHLAGASAGDVISIVTPPAVP